MASKPNPDYYTPLPADLTPEEQNVIQYHRNNLDTGLYQTNPDGSPTTFKGAVMGTPEGAMLFPTYWHGSVMEPRTEFRMAARSGIGFPTYKDDATALAREQVLHKVMEEDSKIFMKLRKKK